MGNPSFTSSCTPMTRKGQEFYSKLFGWKLKTSHAAVTATP